MSGDVSEIGTGVHHSLSALAQEFGMARETLRKRLDAAGVKPTGEHRGNPLWRVRDVYQAIITGPDSPIDPAALPPIQRKAHYQAQLEEIRYLNECGRLIPADQYEEELSYMAKLFVRWCDTLPDVLERDAALTPPQVEKLIESVDKLRDELAEQMSRDEAQKPDEKISAD